MSSTRRDRDRALAYPEPPASPCWHRHGPKPTPLTPEQQRHNREALALALHAPRPRAPRTSHTLTVGADS
ncbi:hypothetical protein [Streptomyces sp. Ag109_O5-10]|uniref:hypothetical protein n=1 Tax=Streptomyces sp. Ag109_O5-10 TaxID=1855349 RepID=UPI00089AE275|nr:hypothetical protein [Streptomyces sp. Ag109_O5-10]SEF19013.1 hypothetical protein SAMN05216533_8561 [Streptomyces sp. Ag109_O5-10]